MDPSDETIIEQLKESVASVVSKTGPHSKFAQDLLQKIDRLQLKMDSLSQVDRYKFISEMKESFLEAKTLIDRRLAQHANFAQTYSSSIAMAVLLIVVTIFALFGYKLYKSLTEKELKKQEKLKSKQAKKAKKTT